jgi:anti-sigma B factor antagonist
MALSVVPRVENEIAILDLEGTLTLGPNLHGVRDAARDALAQNRLVGVVVNVAGVTTADSAGLGELTVVYTFAAKRGARVVIAAASAMLRSMLEVTHLDGLLPVADDVAAAKKLVADLKKG